jgi:P-type Cu+ transporter
VPVITYIAIATWVIWLGLGLGGVLPSSYLDIDAGGWPLWSLQFAVAVFVIGTHSTNSWMLVKLMYSACPCGLALAAPTACFVGGGLCAKYGILANGGGEAFQEAAGISCVVFDKTGTLTKGGEPVITDVNLLIKDRDSILWTVASELEKNSSHPLAMAVTAASKHHQMVSAVGGEIEEIAGKGLRGFIKAESTGVKYQAIMGNERWMDENQAVGSAFINLTLEEWKRQGKSVILMAMRVESGIDEFISGERFTIVAAFAAADPIRAEATPVVAHLQSQGITVWMISGDNLTTAKAVAKMVGIREECVIAGVLPQEKVYTPTC